MIPHPILKEADDCKNCGDKPKCQDVVFSKKDGGYIRNFLIFCDCKTGNSAQNSFDYSLNNPRNDIRETTIQKWNARQIKETKHDHEGL